VRKGKGRGVILIIIIIIIIIIVIIILVIAWNTMKFKRSHSEFEQGCVLSGTYTATDALLPILPACR
jgi:flagellar basal body-associated protein FliL